MILVTGSKGLVGSHLCKKLEELERPYSGIDLPGYDISKFTDTWRLFEKHIVSPIIHCAAMSYIPSTLEKPVSAAETNIMGTLYLLELARKYNVEQFIYLSSVSTYGDFGNWLVNEGFPLRPKGIYGATKAAGDHLTQAYYNCYQLNTTVIRTSSVYGSGDSHPRIVKNFIKNAQEGKPLVIKGTGQLRRDFTYVKDLVNGILLCLDNCKAYGQAFNITGGRDYSLNDLAGVVKKLFPSVEIKYEKGRKIDLARGALDISKAQQVLGYQPQYDLEKGIKEMIDEHRVEKKLPVKENYYEGTR